MYGSVAEGGGRGVASAGGKEAVQHANGDAGWRVRIRVRVRFLKGFGLGLGRGVLATTAHSIFVYSKIGQIAIFSHCQL